MASCLVVAVVAVAKLVFGFPWAPIFVAWMRLIWRQNVVVDRFMLYKRSLCILRRPLTSLIVSAVFVFHHSYHRFLGIVNFFSLAELRFFWQLEFSVVSVVFGVGVSCVCVFWSSLSYRFFSCMPLKPLSLLV